MKFLNTYRQLFTAVSVALMLVFSQSAVMAASAEELNKEADIALEKLYKSTPVAKKLAAEANGILIFPSILKAGLILAGQGGDGVLRVNGETTAYYSSRGASIGLQAGGQTYGYVMFMMTPAAMKSLEEDSGWEVGVGPTVVVVDAGMAKNLTTTTAKDDVYAFIFGQEGLMAGLGLQGNKITRIEPDK